MLRPERMSKVSVTGARSVMDDVVEAVHDLHLLQFTDYDGGWEGFDPGTPGAEAEAASEKLVTIRALESTLDVDPADAGPTRILDEGELAEELASVRETVNDLDDRRGGIEDDLRAVEEDIERVEPLSRLGIDLDLLSGYDAVEVRVGAGDPAAIERALAKADPVRAFETFAAEGVVAAVAAPAEGEVDVLSDALVGVEFAPIEVPDVEGPTDPDEFLRELESRREDLQEDLEAVEGKLAEVRSEAAGFLLAAEEQLTIQVQKAEAPLSFATTDHAFVAEGWIPTARYAEFERAVADAVGDHAEVEELERASYTDHGLEGVSEEAPARPEGGEGGVDAGPGPAPGEPEAPAAADGSGGAAEEGADGGRPRADGGNVVMRADDPPVVQDNPGVVKPFEVLVEAVSRPRYTEFDPSAILFLTFPAFFGFMIGDLGYGVLYTAIGYYLYTNFEADTYRSMGGIAIACGLSTVLFGILYGEVFGTHWIATLFWEGLLGLKAAPIHKGLQPGELAWAQGWLVVSVLAGVVHLNVGWLFEFVEDLQIHDLRHAVLESGSWLLMLNGLWVWVFSEPQGVKPALLYEVFDGGEAAAIALGFSGFSPTVGLVGVAAFALGLLLLAVGEPVEVIEFLNVFVNVLSYTRIAAVLLAKAGMAFVVNLLFFGAYLSEGEFHFMYNGEAHGEVLFGGLLHGEIGVVLLGLVVLVVGHLLVLALGITSAGLQAVRLEYVEFFGKFYEGGGREYEPFGRERVFTAEE